MTLHLRPTSCLLLLLAALPAAAFDAPRAGETGAVLWAEPAGAVYSVANTSESARLVYIPLGFSVPLSERRALTVELSLFDFVDCDDTSSTHCLSDTRGVRLSVGQSFSSKSQQRGAFIQPRASFTLMHNAQKVSEGVNGSTTEAAGFIPALELGLDIGYQWRVGRLYVATLLGVGGGLAFHADDNGSLLLNYSQAEPGEGGAHPVVSFNVNVLRIGWGL